MIRIKKYKAYGLENEKKKNDSELSYSTEIFGTNKKKLVTSYFIAV